MRELKYNAIDSQLDYLDTSLSFEREVSCFALPEVGVISTTTNHSSGGVEFDWFTIKDKIWSLKSNSLENGYVPNIAYMIHTHPMGFNRMSSIDRNMVYGWCMALGMQIWFLVVTEEELATYICMLNKETKKVERDLVDLSNHADLSVDLRVLVSAMYGMSKSKSLSNEDLQNVFKEIENSTLNWESIHDWNIARPWNQVTYMES